MRKPIIGEEFSGTLVDTPRTIRGIVVIDVVDSKGKKWTSPTTSKLSELIVKATYESGLLRPGYKVWWVCEGTIPSRKGKPTYEFSVRFMDGDKIVYERVLITNPVLRRKVSEGMSLEEALEIQGGEK